MKLLLGVILTVALGILTFSAVPAAAMDCDAIATAYTAAISAAQVCDLATPDSCNAKRAWSLQDVCRCQVAVNPARTAEADQLLAQFQSQSCVVGAGICTRLCVAPAHSCVAGAGPSPTCTGP